MRPVDRGSKWKNINDRCASRNQDSIISAAVAWTAIGVRGRSIHGTPHLQPRKLSNLCWNKRKKFITFHLSYNRKVIRAYQDSWDHRCRLLFCCMGTSERNRNSFADIAKLLSDFFRELDVVPSDVVAGLVLLRKFQKLERQAIVRQVIG